MPNGEKQNGAELGQAQLKLGLDFTLVFENMLSLNPALKWKKNHPIVP